MEHTKTAFPPQRNKFSRRFRLEAIPIQKNCILNEEKVMLAAERADKEQMHTHTQYWRKRTEVDEERKWNETYASMEVNICYTHIRIRARERIIFGMGNAREIGRRKKSQHLTFDSRYVTVTFAFYGHLRSPPFHRQPRFSNANTVRRSLSMHSN